MIRGFFFSLILAFSVLVWAHDGHRAKPGPKSAETTEKKFQPIIIYPDASLDSHRHDTTDRIQVITKEKIEKTSSTSLADIVDNQPGVDTQDYCVNCGAKRLTINGLRAEHTSILVDGIPLYSSISSVYGLDAIPALAIEEIEVMRGSGSALINPEAIGGAINILSLHPEKTSTKLRASLGTYQSQNYEFLHQNAGEKIKWSLGGEVNQVRAWDEDRNGLSESPFRRRQSFFLKQTWSISDTLQWSLRGGHTQLDIIGGNTRQFRPTAPATLVGDEFDFVGGDVRLPFTGTTDKITDYLQIERTEVTSKLLKILDERNTLEFNVGSSFYTQDSIYMHGFDYDNKNFVLYGDLRWNHQLTSAQSLLVGVSGRKETLRSESQVMYDQGGIPRDNFNYLSIAGFVQHEWLFGHGWELSSALRVDKLDNSWLELRDLQETVVAPRFLLKWAPSDHFANYFSYGRGYRLPLSFVESAHGTYSDGFVVNVTDLEKSDSYMVSSSYNTETYYITPSLHLTRLYNMAYDEEPLVAHAGPIEFVTSSEAFNIVTYEFLAGIKPIPEWLIEASFESFEYDDTYKGRLPTAAIERRVTLKSQLDWRDYSFFISGVWTGARDLTAYSNYEDQFNVNDGALLGARDPKWPRSPRFSVWNASLSKKFKTFEAMLGVDNIFDYTQTGRGDSPAMWHAHGAHAHLDNRHVWGPNRGREVYVRLTYEF